MYYENWWHSYHEETYTKPGVAHVHLPLREAVVVVQHDHILGSLADAVGRVVLDEAEVVRQLQAASPRGHEDDARVLGTRQQGDEVLYSRRGPGGVGRYRSLDGLADGLGSTALFNTSDACL